MSENRKPVVIAIVVAVVLVVAFVVAAGFGGRGNDSGASWTEFLSGAGGSSSLGPDDLRTVEGSCSVLAARIDVAGSCVLKVDGFGGGFAFGDVVKKATLVAMDGTIRLQVSVEGTTVSQSIDPGDETRLTFGTSGGTLKLTCAGFGVSTCSADIRK